MQKEKELGVASAPSSTTATGSKSILFLINIVQNDTAIIMKRSFDSFYSDLRKVKVLLSCRGISGL